MGASVHIERIVPGTLEWDAFYANHIFRYRFALDHLGSARTILDAACGVGYGSAFLTDRTEAELTGIDVDAGAIAVAREKFARARCRFLEDDCATLAAVGPRGPFDAIVSFETLEHLREPGSFLARVRALLSPGGRFIVSTPNAQVTSANGQVDQHFHEREYRASELLMLVASAGFVDVELYGQALSSVGRLRDAMRAELNRLDSNPMARLGRWLQRHLRGHADRAMRLPEQLEDFELQRFASSAECEGRGADGPFVLLATARAPAV